MGPTADDRHYVKYETWYEFKKDLEANVEHPLCNDLWLQLKPKAPLPWDLSQMKLAQSKFERLLRMNIQV